MTRKSLLALPVALAVLLAGCTSAAPEATPTDPASSATAGAFPATVEGPFGDVTVQKRPTRVLSIANIHVDTLVSLGVQPLATLGTEEELWEYYPWLKDTYTGEGDPTLSTNYEAQLQAVSKWKPDLIVADTSLITEEAYADFADLAPTYLSASLGANDMKKSLRDLASLTGTVEKGDAVLAELDATVNEAKTGLECVQGKTYASGFLTDSEFMRVIITPLNLLGLEPADDYTAGTAPERGRLSLENVDQLDADVLSIGTWANPKTPEILGADPRFTALPAPKNNAVIYADGPNAVAGNGPMGLTWQIDTLANSLADSNYCKK